MSRGERARGGHKAPAAAHLPAAVALVSILLAGIAAERQSAALAGLTERNAALAEAEALGAELGLAVSREAALAERLAGALAAAAPGTDPAAAVEIIASGGLPEAGRNLAALPFDAEPAVFPPGDGPPALPAGALTGSGARLAGEGDAARFVSWTTVPHGAGGHRGYAATSMPAGAVIAPTLAAAERAGLSVALLQDGGAAMLGPAEVLDGDPVRVPVAAAGAGWELAAVPQDGWPAHPGARWPIRLLTLLAIGLVVGPMMRTRWLIEQRQQNVIELREREAELERLSRRLGLALDASKVGVWDFNIDTDVLVWDERMDELYGYAPGRRHSYTDWRDRLHPDDLARAEAEFREAVEVTGRYVSDYRLVLPGDALRHIRAIGAVYRETDGSSKIVGVNWDVTADVQRNAELEARRLEAEGASIAKSQFLATMSHEIRTPMNGVIGMLDLMLRTNLDPVQRERAVIASDSARQLLSLLNDILDLSKLEANGVSVETAPVDARLLVREVVALMATGAASREVEVGLEVAPAVPQVVECDGKRLRQVLINLVGNAIKFTEAGTVEVRLAYADGGWLDISVRDTGCGISEEDKQRLFQRFAQVDSSPTRQRGGTGLGLAISRQLVELMGGEIGVQSVPGLGSTFGFRVPAPAVSVVADAVTVEPAPVPIVAELAAVPPARVLVAEDNPTNQQILAAYLAMAGHEARMVKNGVEALAAVQDETFDLVVMDIQMPIMDGITAAERIRGLGGPVAAIPIIALTANAMQGDREYCLAAGMSEYVSKPVLLEEFYAAIARCLAPYSSSLAVTGAQPSPGSKLSIAAATFSVSSPRSAS